MYSGEAEWQRAMGGVAPAQLPGGRLKEGAKGVANLLSDLLNK
jgi:hypothetical protein